MTRLISPRTTKKRKVKKWPLVSLFLPISLLYLSNLSFRASVLFLLLSLFSLTLPPLPHSSLTSSGLIIELNSRIVGPRGIRSSSIVSLHSDIEIVVGVQRKGVVGRVVEVGAAVVVPVEG